MAGLRHHVTHMLGARDPVPPVVTRVSGDRHLLFVLMEAQRARDTGDLQTERANLCHAVFVAATDGKGAMSETELAHRLHLLGPFDVVPGSGDLDG